MFGTGRKVVHRRLVLWIRPTPGDGPSRLGLVVGKRVGGAVRRNRIKRCLREAFRRLAPDWPVALDAVVVPRAAAPPLTRAEAEDALARSVRRFLERPSRPAATPTRRAPPRRRGRRRS